MARFLVGVAGGIGSGKSTVMRAFQSHGIEAVDADAMSRVVVEPGKPALAEIARHFGPQVLTETGELDRPALRQTIFTDANARHWLEQLLHPLINQELRERLANAQSPYALLVSPLLFETGQDQLVDRVLAIDVPEATQLARASARDGADEAQIKAIMAAQMSREERLARAQDVLDNSLDISEGTAPLDAQVDALHQQYLSLASSSP